MSDDTRALSRRRLLVGATAIGSSRAAAAAGDLPHLAGIVILIDRNDPQVMGHAISYSANLSKHFTGKGLPMMRIEIVANGSGIEVFRIDKSPLKEPLATILKMFPNVSYSMCASSKMIAETKENVIIQPIDGAALVPFGIGRVVERQAQGWAYIHG